MEPYLKDFEALPMRRGAEFQNDADDNRETAGPDPRDGRFVPCPTEPMLCPLCHVVYESDCPAAQCLADAAHHSTNAAIRERSAQDLVAHLGLPPACALHMPYAQECRNLPLCPRGQTWSASNASCTSCGVADRLPSTTNTHLNNNVPNGYSGSGTAQRKIPWGGSAANPYP